MSNFKLSWLKLDVNILDDTKIKILRKYPGGNDLIVLWIGVMCLAMKSDEPGSVEITSGIPYDAESLGYELGIDTKTVELGLSLFIKFKMIDIREGGLIEIINFAKHQDLDRIEYTRLKNKERQAKFREKNKSNALLTCESLGSTPIREEEIRKDKNRIDKIKEDKIKKLTKPEKLILDVKELKLSEQLENKFIEFIKYRKKETRTELLSLRSINSAIKNVGKDFKDESHLIESIEESMNSGWMKIVPTKSFNNKPNDNNESYIDKMIREGKEGNILEAEGY